MILVKMKHVNGNGTTVMYWKKGSNGALSEAFEV